MTGQPLKAPAWADARAAARAARPVPSEAVDFADLDKRVLSDDLLALTPLPAFATSAMDGWAVSGDGPWRVVGQNLAGSSPEQGLAPGSAVVIATGAELPAGTDRIVRREHGSVSGAVLRTDVEPRTDIRPAGEECQQGEVLARAGQSMTPALIGLLAAAGHDSPIQVRRRPVAQLLILGDELLTSGISHDGKVRDSLGPQVPPLLSRLGAKVTGTTRVQDRLADHMSALSDASAQCDFVVTTGGTAAGPVDFLHQAIVELGGELVVDQVAVRPGHPMLLARLSAPTRPGSGSTVPDDVWLLGLPGNPQSAIVGLLTLGQPLIDSLLGRPAAELDRVVAQEPITAPRHETRLFVGTAVGGRFSPSAHLGSAMLRGLASATGFAVVPPGGAQTGMDLEWLPLPG
ncbi:MAG: molybdopterin molybdotransferase MoeA [Candidatus Nanopelagicales bacterium]|nr:molybdopterin molybdotransferase MoeA [Candidatus Nanopelagicales bacterium]MDZ4250674.1 molybdopterin molybdotransferase MoeA [Candidatus Nanopelagicales bacterium]